MAAEAREALRSAKRIVVKVGTAVVAGASGLALGRIGGLVEQLHLLREDGREVLLVTSGAIGVGARKLGMATPVTGVVDRQACAAAGQGALMALYDNLFRQVGEVGAQVLLTEGDFLNRTRYTALHDTLDRLLQLGAIPVINENDTVSTAELAIGRDKLFGDNDRLSALVAAGVDANLLVLLSNVDSVYTSAPRSPGAAPIGTWDEGTEVAFGATSNGGRGGMQSKIAAAEVATRCGAHVVIASGMDPANLGRVVAGEPIGTLFPARVTWSKRRRWLAYATQPEGRLVVNDGARDAMLARNASLLRAGVEEVQGDFEAGAVVAIVTPGGAEFARGIVARAAGDIRGGRWSGERGKPVVHRNDVVILRPESS